MGISFAAIFVRLALPAPPVVTGFYRMFFAGLAIAGYLLAVRRAPSLPRRSAELALLSGVCFGTDLALWQSSLIQTSVATATILVNTTPVLVGVWSVLVLRERLEKRFVAGGALALAGCAILVGRPDRRPEDEIGALLALSAAVFYAGYLLLMKSARRDGEAVPALFVMTASATVTLGLIALLRGDAFHGFPATSWAAMVGAALVSQIGGLLSIVWALRYLPASAASVMLLVQPVGTALLGWLLLGEALAGAQLLGGLGVLLGVGLASRSAASAGGRIPP